ncbi:P-loop containing nucleoside triphosphate hydrolase protein [Lentinus brumalis]|uniref:P-loop containing nucleoside triphosphate hydrolase protein n=1 Tax=Lentinus brumalis TaxID=2498619 RepID=A0A371CJ97_9APHY|nr:P-loop containing nucleoside triphosphate hydrolase protein [Polyporus brumalis]
MSQLLSFLLDGCNARDKIVRFRVCQCIADTVVHFGSIDEDLYAMLRAPLSSTASARRPLWRGRGASSHIRKTFDELDEDDTPILDIVFDALAYDTSPDVRRTILQNLPLSPAALPPILERSRNVDGGIRRMVYSNVLENFCLPPEEGSMGTIGRTHPKALSIAQREMLVRNGLWGSVWHGAGLSFFVIYGAYSLAFNFGTTLINHGQATSGESVNVIFAILIGRFSLALLAPEMQAITQARGAAAKLYETIDRHVDFNYPSRPNVPIVKDLSITFPAGTTALVGASGSGKSTVISLVERFYDPLAGVVKLDGIDLKELNVKWLRTQVGLVSQEPTLIATTIKGNVAHGVRNADGFITKLPLDYETMSEGVVQIALDKAAHGRTTITIAHRLSTIKDADRIYVMGNGVILEFGTHDELLRDENGPYARLVQAQKLRDSQEKRTLDSGSIEKDVADQIPLQRQNTGCSLASGILEQREKERSAEHKDYSLFYIFKRLGYLNRALWKLGATTAIGSQNYFFAKSASELTSKLRSLSFRAILRQDIVPQPPSSEEGTCGRAYLTAAGAGLSGQN